MKEFIPIIIWLVTLIFVLYLANRVEKWFERRKNRKEELLRKNEGE